MATVERKYYPIEFFFQHMNGEHATDSHYRIEHSYQRERVMILIVMMLMIVLVILMNALHLKSKQEKKKTNWFFLQWYLVNNVYQRQQNQRYSVFWSIIFTIVIQLSVKSILHVVIMMMERGIQIKMQIQLNTNTKININININTNRNINNDRRQQVCYCFHVLSIIGLDLTIIATVLNWMLTQIVRHHVQLFVYLYVVLHELFCLFFSFLLFLCIIFFCWNYMHMTLVNNKMKSMLFYHYLWYLLLFLLFMMHQVLPLFMQHQGYHVIMVN